MASPQPLPPEQSGPPGGIGRDPNAQERAEFRVPDRHHAFARVSWVSTGRMRTRTWPRRTWPAPNTSYVSRSPTNNARAGGAWLEAERPNLHAAADHAATTGRTMHAVQIPAALGGFLRERGHWDQATALIQTALTAARQAATVSAKHALSTNWA